jgi:hypothetical protein
METEDYLEQSEFMRQNYLYIMDTVDIFEA